VGRICEYAGDFIPTELLIAIDIGITTPIIRKVSAICLALIFGENLMALGEVGMKYQARRPRVMVATPS
jgi:hypothetical protein